MHRVSQVAGVCLKQFIDSKGLKILRYEVLSRIMIKKAPISKN
jgi:hypothetical protein